MHPQVCLVGAFLALRPWATLGPKKPQLKASQLQEAVLSFIEDVLQVPVWELFTRAPCWFVHDMTQSRAL